jgi:hypothetical protein
MHEPTRTPAGRIIDENQIAAWAAEAERGYDLDALPAIPGHAGTGHTADGPPDCERCQAIRECHAAGQFGSRYICRACQVSGCGPEAGFSGKVRCWCCGRLVPAWRRGMRGWL